MSKAYTIKRLRFCTDNDSKEDEKQKRADAKLERSLKLSSVRNSHYALKIFRKKSLQKYKYLTGCHESSETESQSEHRAHPKREAMPINNAFEIMRKKVKEDEPAKDNSDLIIEQAYSFIKRIRQKKCKT
jgi:hypothetical protein